MNEKSIYSILFCLVISIYSSGQTTFQKYIPDSLNYYNPSINKTMDGGFIIGNGGLTKTDSLGNVEWIRKIYNKTTASAQQTIDGGYAIAGYISNPGSLSETGFFLSKTDSIGNYLWSKSYHHDNLDKCSSMQQTSDGGFILAGTTVYANNYCGFVIRTDLNGDTLWTKIFSDAREISTIIQTRKGGFLLGGYTESITTPRPDPYLILTDSIGDIIWAKSYVDSEGATINSLCQMTDDEFIILLRGSTPISSTGMSLIKINSIGNIIWAQSYGSLGDYYWPRYVNIAQDGGIILTSDLASIPNITRNDILFMKTDSSGNQIWNQTFSSTRDETPGGVISMNDGTYLITGVLHDPYIGNPYNGGGCYLIKTDSMGNNLCFANTLTIVQTNSSLIDTNLSITVNSGCLVNSITLLPDSLQSIATDACLFLNVNRVAEESISVFPNPSNGRFRITTMNYFQNGTIRIFDSQAKKIAEKYLTGSSSDFDLGDIPNGIYFVVATDGVMSFTKKMIVEKY